MNASTFFTTENAQRCLGMLGKRVGHKVVLALETGSGRIELPFGLRALNPRLTATTKGKPQIDKRMGVTFGHLERFAFREPPKLTWQLSAA